ncbi:MAG: carbohydrate kinase family protein [Candidatus Falkowbacteria bacterium]
MKYDVITIGGATEDVSLYSSDGVLLKSNHDALRQKLLAFEYGSKVVVDKAYSNFGGGAANVAVNLAGLGYKTAILINIGADERGRRIFNNFKKHDVATKLVNIDFNSESAVSFIIINKTGERLIFTDRGANKKLQLKEENLKAIKNCRWVYIASLANDNWQADLKKIFAVCGPKIIWNPGHEQLIAGYDKLAKFLKQTDVLCLNKEEAIELVLSVEEYKHKTISYLNDVKNLLKIINSFGPQMVLITSGSLGADVYNGLKYYHVAPVKSKKIADKTGVGDAFCSTFLFGLEKCKGNISSALKLASRQAAAVMTVLGAQNGLLKKKDLK